MPDVLTDTVETTPAFTVPPFARACLDHAGRAWEAAHDHPFVHALADGTLDSDRFRFYQMQDARYLEAFADASSLISTRCPRPADKLWFIDAARLALVVEGELHAGYGEELGYGPDDIAALEARTEGWITGLHLAALSLHGHADVSRRIASFSGSHRFVLDYLIEEVLEQQPEGALALLQPGHGAQTRPQQPDPQALAAVSVSRPDATGERAPAFRRPVPDLDAETLARMRVPRGTFLDIQV